MISQIPDCQARDYCQGWSPVGLHIREKAKAKASGNTVFWPQHRTTLPLPRNLPEKCLGTTEHRDVEYLRGSWTCSRSRS